MKDNGLRAVVAKNRAGKKFYALFWLLNTYVFDDDLKKLDLGLRLENNDLFWFKKMFRYLLSSNELVIDHFG